MAGVQRLQQVGGLAAPHLADDDVVGPVAERVPDQVADRHGRLGADRTRLEAQAVGALDPELERVLDGDDPLLLGEQLDQGVEERGLPRAGASGDQDVPAGPRGPFRAARNTVSGRAPWSTRSSAENARPPNRRMVMATWGLAGGVQMATREPSSRRASRMGRGGRIEPERARDVDRRPVERGGGERRRLDGLELGRRVRPRRCRGR